MKNRTTFLCAAFALCLMLLTDTMQAQFTEVWKVSAGTWPMGSASATRGAALNRSNGHYLVTNRDIPRIYVFNASTGDLMDSLNMTGVTGGGGSVLQDIEVTNDGVVYASNLILNGLTENFKIYRWADDNNATVPTVAFSGPLMEAARVGDAIDVAGTGTGTVIYAGGNNSATDSVQVFTTTDGLAFLNTGSIKITGNDAGMGIAQITPGGDFLTSRYSTGAPIRLYSGTGGGRLESVPTTVTPAFQADIAYLEAAGRKWVASVESLATAGHGHKAVLLNTTYGLNGAVKVGATPVIGTVANTSSIGADVEMQYNAADSTMTVYLMVDNNGIAAYKSGNVLTTNLAPLAGNIVRTQYVPMSGVNDTVYVDVQDDEYIPTDSVLLIYTVDGGPGNIVTMTLSSGDSIKGKYIGIIPGSANTNDKRIAYNVTATDNKNSKSMSSTSGYFAGTTKMAFMNGPRAIDTTTGVMLWTGYGVRVQGVCTQEDSLIAIPTSRHDVVLQDEVGAVDLIEFANSSIAPPWRMKRGNRYSAMGVLGQFNGKLQIAIPGPTGAHIEVVDLGPAPLPAPEPVTIRDIAFDRKGEILENALVRVSHLHLTPGSLSWPAAVAFGTNITVTDNGVDSMTLRVPALSTANGFPPKEPFTVIGLAGQFDNTNPYTSGYQVIMRNVDDLLPELMVGLKDTTKAVVNTDVVLPVFTGNITGTGITAFKFTAQYDSTALQFTSASSVGTLSQGYTISSHVVKNGMVQVAAFGTQPLKDSGSIVNFNFKVLQQRTSTVDLSGEFNEGNPIAMVVGGVFVGEALMENEPNDSLSVANPIALGMNINGNLSSTSGDHDYYWFDAPVGHLVVDVTDASDATDADIYLYDAAGKLLYNVDRNGNDRLEYNIATAAKYYVKVSGYLSGGSYATGPYTLFARMGPATDPNEPNDGPLFGFYNIATPAGFNFVDSVSTLDPGVGIPGNDYDYFRVIANAGQNITAKLQAKSFKSTTSLNGIRIRLYSRASFPSILVGQDKTDGSDAMISYTVSAADTFFVRVFNTVGSEAGPNARYRLTISGPTGVFDHVEGLPLVFALDQNFPNPFNPSTTINFALPNSASTHLIVYDMLGREVRTLINSEMGAGYYESLWDGKNNSGGQVASGMYIYRIEAGSFVATKKMMLLK